MLDAVDEERRGGAEPERLRRGEVALDALRVRAVGELAADALGVEPESRARARRGRRPRGGRAPAYSASCISQNAPWAAAASAASAAWRACGCTDSSGRWRKAKRSSSPRRERTRARIDCAAAQYGHSKSPYITSS